MSLTVGLELELRNLARLAPVGYYVALHIRFGAPMLMFRTFPQDWTDRYTEQAYTLRDPLVAWGFSTEGTTRWSEITIDPFGIMAEAARYGLGFGACVACGPISSRTIAGIARNDREFTDAEIAKAAELVSHIHAITEPPESLTPAQIEALRLIAAGDRHATAAAKLNISESALKARLNSARQRLLARTTAEAIQRAKDYRLL